MSLQRGGLREPSSEGQTFFGPGVLEDVTEQLRRSITLGENTSLGVEVFGPARYGRLRESYMSARDTMPHVLLRPFLDQIVGT